MKHLHLFALIAWCLLTACNHGCIDYESTYDHWLPSDMIGKEAYYTDGADTFMVKGSPITHLGDDRFYAKNSCGCRPYALMTQSGPKAEISLRASYSWQKGEKDKQNGKVECFIRGMMMGNDERPAVNYWVSIQMKPYDACDKDLSRITHQIAERTVLGQSYSDVLMNDNYGDTIYYVQKIGLIEFKIGNVSWKRIPDHLVNN